jgi:hypothetical protein
MTYADGYRDGLEAAARAAEREGGWRDHHTAHKISAAIRAIPLPVPAPADDEARVDAMAQMMCRVHMLGHDFLYTTEWEKNPKIYRSMARHALAALRAMEGKG